MDISIIIPAYNESEKISHDILAADKFLSNQNFTGEIIIVDDGSSDNTFQIANHYKSNSNNFVNVIKLSHNVGKGGAIVEGIKN